MKLKQRISGVFGILLPRTRQASKESPFRTSANPYADHLALCSKNNDLLSKILPVHLSDMR